LLSERYQNTSVCPLFVKHWQK